MRKGLETALAIHRFYRDMEKQKENPKWGVQKYAFHSTGKTYEFEEISEIKYLLRKMISSMKRKTK